MSKIPLYPSSVAPNEDDLLIIEDSVTANTKKIKRSDLLGGNTITATNDIKTDVIEGIADADSGEVYGITVTNGQMSGDDLENGSVKPAKLILGSCSKVVTPASAQTNTTTTNADVTNLSDSITTSGGALVCALSLSHYVSGGEVVGSLLINGVNYTLTDTNLSTAHGMDSGYYIIPAGTVPAGTYTVKAQFKCSGGGNTATIPSYNSNSFSVFEI